MNPVYHVRAKLPGDLSMQAFGERFADPLYAALQERNFGDLTGGSGEYDEAGKLASLTIDLRLVNLDDALTFTRDTLQKLGAPAGSEIEYTVDGKTFTQPIDDPLVV